MKDQNKHFVIVTNYGTYWAGYNTFTDQLRKAQFYNSEKHAHTAAADAIRRYNKHVSDARKIQDYMLLVIEINTVDYRPGKPIEE